MTSQASDPTRHASGKGVASSGDPVKRMLRSISVLGHASLILELFVHGGSRKALRDRTTELGHAVTEPEDGLLDEAAGSFGDANAELLRSIGHHESLIRFVE